MKNNVILNVIWNENSSSKFNEKIFLNVVQRSIRKRKNVEQSLGC